MKFRSRTLTSLGQNTLSVNSATARLDSLNASAFPPRSRCPGPGTFCELPVSAQVEAAETLAVGHLGKDEFPRAPVGLTDDGLNLARNWGPPLILEGNPVGPQLPRISLSLETGREHEGALPNVNILSPPPSTTVFLIFHGVGLTMSGHTFSLILSNVPESQLWHLATWSLGGMWLPWAGWWRGSCHRR